MFTTAISVITELVSACQAYRIKCSTVTMWVVGPVHLISFNTEVYYRVNDFLKHSLDDLVLQYNWLEKDLQVHLCPSIVGYSRWNKSSEFPVKTAKNACLQLVCALLRLLLIALNKDRSRSGVATPMPLFEK